MKQQQKNDRGRSTTGLVITVSGPHGSGKSTYAKALAESLNLRYVCAGVIFRQMARERGMSLEQFGVLAAKDRQIDFMIDDRTRREAEAGRVVIDAQLAAWIVNGLADVKLLLTASDAIRYKRIADRDGISTSIAAEETRNREKVQRERYKRYYNIDVDDLTIYDLKIDTDLTSVEETKNNIVDAVKRFLAYKSSLRNR
jgi:cytidylate kinase